MNTEEYVPEEASVGALGHHLWGILHAHERRYEDAVEAFRRAIETDPEMVGSYVELGLVYACRSEYATMVEVLRQAVDVGASAVRAYLGEQPLGDVPAELTPDALATSRLAEGRDDEAARILEQVLRLEPGRSPAARALLALSYLLRGDRVEADDEGIRRGIGTART